MPISMCVWGEGGIQATCMILSALPQQASPPRGIMSNTTHSFKKGPLKLLRCTTKVPSRSTSDSPGQGGKCRGWIDASPRRWSKIMLKPELADRVHSWSRPSKTCVHLWAWSKPGIMCPLTAIQITPLIGQSFPSFPQAAMSCMYPARSQDFQMRGGSRARRRYRGSDEDADNDPQQQQQSNPGLTTQDVSTKPMSTSDTAQQ